MHVATLDAGPCFHAPLPRVVVRRCCNALRRFPFDAASVTAPSRMPYWLARGAPCPGKMLQTVSPRSRGRPRTVRRVRVTGDISSISWTLAALPPAVTGLRNPGDISVYSQVCPVIANSSAFSGAILPSEQRKSRCPMACRAPWTTFTRSPVPPPRRRTRKLTSRSSDA